MNERLRLKATFQKDSDTSSWTFFEVLQVRLWEILWLIILRWTPKKFNVVRLLVLKLFGASIHGHPFVSPSARIYAPFNLEIHDKACIGPRVNIYNLGKVILCERCIISLEAMLCGGTHDFTSRRLPLLVGEVEVGEDVFIGTRAIVLPGVCLGTGAIVGAAAVVSKDVEPWSVVAGNPATAIKRREFLDE